MTWKPKLIVASSILGIAVILRVFGINSFIEVIGYMAAGYIFGTLPETGKKEKGGE